MLFATIERLEKFHKYNIREWLEETLSREFGMCSTLTEEPYMSKQDILKQLEYGIPSHVYIPSEIVLRTKEQAEWEHGNFVAYGKERIQDYTKKKEIYENLSKELENIYKIAQQENANLMLAVLEQAKKLISCRVEICEDAIKCWIRDISAPFEYDEKKEKEYYDKKLKQFEEAKQKANKAGIEDKSQGYKQFLKEVEQVFNKMEPVEY